MSGAENASSIQQYSPPQDDGARFAADAAAMVGDIQDNAEVAARVRSFPFFKPAPVPYHHLPSSTSLFPDRYLPSLMNSVAMPPASRS